jgi:hypothetical protein
MDTSETYVKMRRWAIPDLGMGSPPVFSAGAEVQWLTPFVCTDISGNFYYSSKDEVFQLERQDQLQEMINWQSKFYFSKNILESKVMSFALYWMEQLDGYSFSAEAKKFTSLEQLWLAFVMKEGYNKVWNGGEWTTCK